MSALNTLLMCFAIAAGPVEGDFEDPLEASPEINTDNRKQEFGGAISSLRGPTGFNALDKQRGPSLSVEQISIRVVLHPDLALVEQTYTLVNDGKSVRTVVGIRQNDAKFGQESKLTTYIPISNTAWLNGHKVPSDDIDTKSAIRPGRIEEGYNVSVRASFPPGKSTLSILSSIQTIENKHEHGATKPNIGGTSRFALQVDYFSWDWNPKQDDLDPIITTQLSTGPGVAIRDLHAEEWSTGFTDGNSFWWRTTPWIVLQYKSQADAKRLITRDELESMGRALTARAPRGHLVIPNTVEPVLQPRRSSEAPPVDVARARRGLLIPFAVVGLLLLLAFALRRMTPPTL